MIDERERTIKTAVSHRFDFKKRREQLQTARDLWQLFNEFIETSNAIADQ